MISYSEYMYAVWFIFNHKQCSFLIHDDVCQAMIFFIICHMVNIFFMYCIRFCCCIDITIIILSFIRISFLNLRLTKPMCLYFKICLYRLYLRNKDSFFASEYLCGDQIYQKAFQILLDFIGFDHASTVMITYNSKEWFLIYRIKQTLLIFI